MGRHPKHIKGFHGSPGDLALSIGNMRYDKVADVIGELAAEIQRQAEADQGRGRHRLAGSLGLAATRLAEALSAMEDAWEICKPHMTD